MEVVNDICTALNILFMLLLKVEVVTACECQELPVLIIDPVPSTPPVPPTAIAAEAP
mgnify:CR=1 FL=1